MATMIASEKPVVVTVRNKCQMYATLRTAVLHHNMLRDKSGKGASKWVPWIVECEGEIYHIGYNGRVWVGMPSEWEFGATEVIVEGATNA